MATDFLIPHEPPQEDLTEPSNEFSMLHLTNNNNHSPPPTSQQQQQQPCVTCGFNPMKRRSPESQLESSRPKKLSCDQEDQQPPSGFSSVSLPLSLESLAVIHNTTSPLPVFRRCFSDPYTVPSSANAVGAPLTPNLSPENNNSLASGLPPRPPSLKRCVSDPSSTPGKTNYQDSGLDLSKEEISNLMRMRRMKDRLREMKKWWDEVMQEEEEEEDQVDEANKAISVSHQVDESNKAMSVSEVDEGNKAICVSQDDSGMEDGGEEIVSVEWVEKSLCVNFKCPCGKGYQILLSGNKCYYKLV